MITVAESFFSTLEFELGMTADWRTREEARTAVFEYLETKHNRQRLGYLSPAVYEEQFRIAA